MTGLTPLPLAEGGSDHFDDSQWAGAAQILGPRWSHMSSLTICFLGVQLFWSIEMAYASPYLLSLGLSKSLMAMVFLAGPLSGLVVQPLVGVLADHSKSRFGRRRPFMIGGSVICALAMLLLGYTRPISSIFTVFGSYSNNVLTIWLAILAIYCIDFSINAVQAMDRALLVDTLPTIDQARGNAWAARMLGVGSVAGFFVGNIDMTRILPFLGSEQLEVMSVFAAFLLLFVQFVTSSFVKEKVLVAPSKGKRGFISEMRILFRSISTLPRVIRQIFMIQFFSSIAWFPVLFYTTVYVGELHKRSSPLPPDAPEAAFEGLEAEANRLGSRALFFSSIISLLANVFLPFFVREASSEQGLDALSPSLKGKTCIQRMQIHMVTIWTVSYAVFTGCMFATFLTSSVFGATILIAITGFSWAIAQWAPFSLLGEAILTESCTDDDAPRPIRLSDRQTRQTPRGSNGGDDDEEERQFLVGDENDDPEPIEIPRSRSTSIERDREDRPHAIVRNSAARISLIDVNTTNGRAFEDESDDKPPSRGGLSAKAGIILGLHNIFIVIPQFLVTGLAALVFAIVEPNKSVLHGHNPGIITPLHNTTLASTLAGTLPDDKDADGRMLTSLTRQEGTVATAGPNSVAIIFRIGGVASAIAFILCLRLGRELKRRR